MSKLSLELKIALLALFSLLLLAGCPRPSLFAPDTTPTDSLEGRVDFGGRAVQANVGEVANASTVSLIDASSNVTVASSVTTASGSFKLSFSGFKPSATASYFIEAVKGLSAGGASNRVGAPVARVRTLIYWRQGWVSLTNSIPNHLIAVTPTTTAVSILAGLRQAAGFSVDFESLVGSVALGVADSSLSPATLDTFIPGASGLSVQDYHTVSGLVDQALVSDQDPVQAIGLDVGPPVQYALTPQAFTVTGVTPSSGMPNDVVTITGTGFETSPANNVVKFNGWVGTTLTASSDHTSMTVRVPRRSNLSGTVSVTIRGLVKLGPTWSQTAWQDTFTDSLDVKSSVNAAVSNGVSMIGAPGYVDTTNAHFTLGLTNGLARVRTSDPVDSGDGALDLGIKPLRVLQVYPDGHSQTVAAQGVYNWRPDLFNFELLPVSTFNTLASLDAAFTATTCYPSSTTPGATPVIGGGIARTMRDYDILYFGVSDSYAGMDLTTNSRDVTRAFAQLGRGVVFTHDTLRTVLPNFWSLSDLHGLGANGIALAGSTVYQIPGINTSSSVLKQPFDLSGVTTFPIQPSHSQLQTADLGATAWYCYDVTRAGITPYWTTYTTSTSNAAFFSYGHTEAVPNEFEAKAMINSMYYTFDRGNAVMGTFISRAQDSGGNGHNWSGSRLNWVYDLPTSNTNATFQVAASDDPNATSLTYVGPDGTVNTSFTSTNGVLPAVMGRYLRYKITLSTTSLLSVPLVSRVDIDTTSYVTSTAVTPSSISGWTSGTFTANLPSGSAVRVHVLDQAGNLIPNTVLSGNVAGFSTSPINLSGLSVATYPALRLKAVLLAPNASNKPQLTSWKVNWNP